MLIKIALRRRDIDPVIARVGQQFLTQTVIRLVDQRVHVAALKKGETLLMSTSCRG